MEVAFPCAEAPGHGGRACPCPRGRGGEIRSVFLFVLFLVVLSFRVVVRSHRADQLFFVVVCVVVFSCLPLLICNINEWRGK